MGIYNGYLAVMDIFIISFNGHLFISIYYIHIYIWRCSKMGVTDSHHASKSWMTMPSSWTYGDDCGSPMTLETSMLFPFVMYGLYMGNHLRSRECTSRHCSKWDAWSLKFVVNTKRLEMFTASQNLGCWFGGGNQRDFEQIISRSVPLTPLANNYNNFP